MVVHAVADIAVDEEITLDYGAKRSKPELSKNISDYYRFDCDCPMCVEERRAPNRNQRNVIYSRYTQEKETTMRLHAAGAIQRLEKVVEELEETYTPAQEYRRLLHGPLQDLSDVLFREGKILEAIAVQEKVLNCDPAWYAGMIECQQRLVDWYFRADDFAKASAYLTRVVRLVETISGIKPNTYLTLREPSLEKMASGKFVHEMISKMPT
jgi:tetratricopeptide (TPR) repeat protein